MGEVSSYMAVIANFSIRAIVDRVNELEIKKEDIVSLLKEGNQYFLVYYKKAD